MNGGPTGKAIEGLSPDLPAKEAARWTLHVRLRAVEHMLSEATTNDGAMDAKTVHRLRVSTRRAAAALRAYKAWTPRKRRTRARKALRRVRRVAAAARLCDVQLDGFGRLMREVDPSLAVPIGVVLGHLAEHRRAAGRDVKRLRPDPRCGRDALKRLRKKLVKATGEGDRDVTLMDLASAQVPELARRLDAAGRADLTAIENVHELRIAGKRARYAVELFECCFTPDAHKAMLERLTQFQDRLGVINDLRDMRHTVENIAADPNLDPDVRAGLDRLVQDLSCRVDRAHADFFEWWSRHGTASIFAGLAAPGIPDGQITARHATRNGDLGTTVDRLIEDAVRHLT